MLRKALISSLCVMFALSGITVAHAEETTNEPVEVTPVDKETETSENTETVTPVPLTEETPTEPTIISAKGTQKAFVVGDDWGAAVSKTIIALDKEITSDSVSADKFVVKETKATPDFSNYPTITVDTVTVERTIIDAYVSDEFGNKIASWWGPSKSKYITVEMYVSPNEGSAFIYTGLNDWCDPYELEVSLVEGATLKTTASETIDSLEVEKSIDLAGKGKICPQIDGVEFYGVYGDTDTSYYYTATDETVVQVPYAYFQPKYDGHKNPIVIWNHGAGEGGTDPQIDVLANEVTAMFGSEFQGIMDGAYVICPQVPKGAPRDANRALAIQALVEGLAAENPDIDLNRVYVGGCSAGGLMTLTSLFTTPDFYTAAFPICAAYRGEVSDEMIESVKDIPVWFIHALNDTTVPYEGGTKVIVDQLVAVGAEVHTSLFKDVHDTTGRFEDENGDPYQYAGHWSWIYFDNNECFDENGVNCWEWLASQTKHVYEYTGTQKVFIVGEEWGAGVTKTIMTLNAEINADSVSVEDFSVIENKDGQVVNRTVLNAYVSDENGNKVTTDSKYVTVELGISPTEGNPITWSMATWRNTWPNSYKLYVNINDGQSITSGETTITEIGVVPTIDVAGEDMICPQLDGVVEDSYTYTPEDGKDVVIPYGFYEPKEDGHKNAVVIWNHGIGEGGTDPKIAMLGNEVTALFGNEFQETMDGAYVLVAQVPNDGARDVNRAEGIIQLVKDLAAENPDIDLDRVLVGGCSAGGGMTMTTILAHPEFFAAAFPICAAGNYTDAQLEAIVDLPVWFIHAKNDDTVNYNNSTKAFVDRLNSLGASEVHTSIFDDVHDTSGRFDDEGGNPYQYSGHWSWVYFFNNECVDENGTNCWEWLANQERTVPEYEDGVTVVPNTNPEWDADYVAIFKVTDKDAVKVTVSGNMQFYKADEVKDYDASGDNSAIPSYNAFAYEDGMFNSGYGINNDMAVYNLSHVTEDTFIRAIPLPGNLYYYDYTITYADGSTKTIKDPANMPEPNEKTGHDAGHSLVYVGDKDSCTAGQEYIYARNDGKTGTYSFVEYKAVDGSTQPLGIYLPKDYNSSKTYKTIYVSHGGGGNENEWMTIGAIPNIMDNLIADNLTKEAIVVTMDNTYFKWDYDKIVPNVLDHIIPFVEANYAVSKEAKDRAFCGLSMGAMTTNTFANKAPEAFGYYGAFSGGSQNLDGTTYNVDALNKAVYYLTAGSIDMAYNNNMGISSLDYLAMLDEIGVKYTFELKDGAHDWGVWRDSFTTFVKDYLWSLDPKPEKPVTGDATQLMPYVVAAGLSALAIVAFVAYKKKKDVTE